MATTLYIDAFNYEGPHSPEDAFNKVADVVAHLVRQKFDRPAITYRHMYIGVTMEEPDAAFSLRMAFDTLTKDQVDREEQRRAELRAAAVKAQGSILQPYQLAALSHAQAAFQALNPLIPLNTSGAFSAPAPGAMAGLFHQNTTPDASGDDGEGE